MESNNKRSEGNIVKIYTDELKKQVEVFKQKLKDNANTDQTNDIINHFGLNDELFKNKLKKLEGDLKSVNEIGAIESYRILYCTCLQYKIDNGLFNSQTNTAAQIYNWKIENNYEYLDCSHLKNVLDLENKPHNELVYILHNISLQQ